MGKSEEESFQSLKHALSTAPALSHPETNQPFLVTTDASKVRLGGELARVDSEEQIHPVAYFSRALAKRERSYPTYDREMMAMRDILKDFRYYLLGARIISKTDHKLLLKLLEQKDPFGQRANMIREFEPCIEYEVRITLWLMH